MDKRITIEYSIRIFLSAGSILFCLLVSILDSHNHYAWAAVLLVLLMSAWMVVLTRRNWLLLTIFAVMLYANYSVCVANHFGWYTGFETMYYATDVANRGIFILLLFLSGVFAFLPAKIKATPKLDFFKRYEGSTLSIVLVLGIIALLVYVLISFSSGFGLEERGENSPVFEYAYILFLLGFYFAADNKVLRYSMTAMSLIWIAQALMAGNRVSVLVVIMLLFFFYGMNRFSWRQILPVAIPAVLFFLFVGTARQNTFDSLENMGQYVYVLASAGFSWDTAAFAYQQSLCFVLLDQLTTASQHAYLLGQWLLSIVLGTSAVPDASLPFYSQNFYSAFGGGFLPFYAYFYFGHMGVLLSGVGVSLLVRLVNNLNNNSSTLAVFVGLVFSASVFRWYLYSPSPLTRGMLILIVASVACLFVFTIREQTNHFLRIGPYSVRNPSAKRTIKQKLRE